MRPPPNSRRTWSWFLVAVGPGPKMGEEEADRAPHTHRGQVVSLKPQPELQPFWTQEQGLDLPAWERAAISFHTPACSSGSSHPFPGAARSFRRAGTHLAWLEGAQDAVCGLGRSPSNQVPPGPLPQEGRPSAGTRNSRGKEPNTSTPGCSGWDPAHSSAVGEAPGSPVGPGWG